MENRCLGRYMPLEAALKRAGYKVDEVEKRDKRTVITVSRYEESDKNLACPIFKAAKETSFNG